jgi:spindle assembly abnormal protein 6
MRTSGNSHHRLLHIELTEEADPFFLYVLEIGETEFSRIKGEQQLLIDFLKFPQHILEFLEICTRPADEYAHYECVFERESGNLGTFNIFETNRFRRMSNLCLKFSSANDQTLKGHLIARLKEYKSKNEDLEHRLRDSEETSHAKMTELKDTRRRLEGFQMDSERQLELVKLESKKDFNEMKEKMMELNRSLQDQLEADKKASIARLEADLQDARKVIDSQAESIVELREAKLRLESTERELSSKVRTLDHEFDLAKSELTSLKTANKSLDSDKYANERSLTEATLKAQNLERQLVDKLELIDKLQALTTSHNEQRSSLEGSLALLKSNVARFEEKLTISAQEINKGNSIIQKLQSEIKAGKQKLKVKNSVVMQQETVINQKQEQLDSQEHVAAGLKRDLLRKDDTVRDLENTISTMRTKLQESQKTLESNGSTIQWLNKQLTEAQQMGKTTYSAAKPSASPFSFKPSTATMERFKPQTPLTQVVNSSPGSFASESSEVPRFTEPVKYREPK